MTIKNKTEKTGMLRPPFQSGQIWQLGDANVEIGLVGKRLVHYKHYKAQAKRPPTLLSGKATLEKLLHDHRAVLLPQSRQAISRRKTNTGLNPKSAGKARRERVGKNRSQPARAD